MNQWQSFSIFVSRDYSENFLQKVWDLGKELVPLFESKTNDFFFIHYCNPKECPQGPHVKVQVCNPDEELITFIDELKLQGYDIDTDNPFEEGKDHAEGFIAKKVFDRVKGIGKENKEELAEKLKSYEDYMKLRRKTGRHYVHNMLQMTCGRYFDEENMFVDTFFH